MNEGFLETSVRQHLVLGPGGNRRYAAFCGSEPRPDRLGRFRGVLNPSDPARTSPGSKPSRLTVRRREVESFDHPWGLV
ncbi:MAG: hypothetical protein CMJ23_06895 [Phycisphaerae bacterium]|nr:hypothetical protein [Phycisphaerae bacterium]